jgi:hypothetical protein
MPKLLQPTPTAETRSPDFPRERVSMGNAPAEGFRPKLKHVRQREVHR